MARQNSRLTESSPLELNFHSITRQWFLETFERPTVAQQKAWPSIAGGRNTLLLAPTGSGKTLAAFLVAIDRLMFPRERNSNESPRTDHGIAGTVEASGSSPASTPGPDRESLSASSRTPGVRVLYISPLKALGVDVERNLRAPLAGVRNVAQRLEADYHLPSVGLRSGDTPADARRQLVRKPPEILITTPESLYLLLTSQARSILRTIDTVIIDEIHSMVAGKRGSHLFVSLERLEDLRRSGQSSSPRQPLQRIGLSATQRPLDEVARLLVGAEVVTSGKKSKLRPREVDIINGQQAKQFDIRIEVPVEDMARIGESAELTSGPTAGLANHSIWPVMHPRLIELIRQHRSTIIFTNSRRLAERLATSLNELAKEELVLAHHGSVSKETRASIEDRLKRGELPAIVATSTLELGIDMGAVDLVIQIESPPSIAAGIQRIGRAGHQVGAKSSGVVFPKFRGDLLACSAAVGRMLEGEVEESFYPRNPLDIVAQQLVAMVSLEPRTVDELYDTFRRAAPFHDLPRSSFEGVLDLLSGRYPSDQFASLKPRVHWDRLSGVVSPRTGAQRLAVLNAGTIPDRGLYGVFLADDPEGKRSRVGELDEEMVFETHAGDVFLLGASSWRVTEITQDRVLVVPAPGEPGKMPFWRGDGPGRPLEFGRAIGALSRELLRVSRDQAEARLVSSHGLEPRAARNLLDYLKEQVECTQEPPTDQVLIVESFLDEVGDWRVVLLSPFGSRVHAPWAMVVAAAIRRKTLGEVDVMWTDDGIAFRLPEADDPPDWQQLIPEPDEVEDALVRELSGTALFAGRFRENAARALLLPRQQPGKRTPLWLQRRKSADLLSVASQYPDFPLMLETYRECLRDVFDLAGLKRLLSEIQSRRIRIRSVESKRPSPFASSLLFSYTGQFLYNGDTPLAERRAHTLALDHAQLRELLGEAELREMLDEDVITSTELELQRLDERFAVRHADGLHEILLFLGDLDEEELTARLSPTVREQGMLTSWLEELTSARRILRLRIAGNWRWVAAEDAARLRDGLGISPPAGLPAAFLESVADPLGDLVSRYARTHVPFRAADVAQRLGIGLAVVQQTLERLAAANRVVAGEFLPHRRGTEWCDVEVLRLLKRRSLAKLRKQIEPVAPQVLGRFLPHWQGVLRPRLGLDGLLDVMEQLQGLPLPISSLESTILPSRVTDFQPRDLDTLCGAGELIWRGFEPLGHRDGRIAFYLADHFSRLAPATLPATSELCVRIREQLQRRGALFFDELVESLGGYPNDIQDALWELVWGGEVTNDTVNPLRDLVGSIGRSATTHSSRHSTFRSRRSSRTSGSDGRWSLLPTTRDPRLSDTERLVSIATQLIARYGVLTRSLVHSENIAGGFAGLYPVLKSLEDSGKVRRGYFVAGLGGAQFAAHGAEHELRQPTKDQKPTPLLLAATDPANPYGTALPWPRCESPAMRPQRAAGARVILLDGELLGFLGKTERQLTTFLPEEESRRNRARLALVEGVAQLAAERAPVYLTHVDGIPPGDSQLAATLVAHGFVSTTRGYLLRGANRREAQHARG